MPRTPRGGGEPTSSLLPLAGPAGLPSCNASSSHSFSIKHLPQARMRPRQLRLGKAHGLAHLLRDLLVRVALHVVQPHHRARRLAQLLEGALQIDPRGHPAHGTVAARRLLVERLGGAHLVAPDSHQGLRRGDLPDPSPQVPLTARSEEHTSELQSPMYLVCRLLLEKK